MNIRLNKSLNTNLQQLQVAIMSDYNLLDDEYDDELPIYFYGMVDEARAKNEGCVPILRKILKPPCI